AQVSGVLAEGERGRRRRLVDGGGLRRIGLRVALEILAAGVSGGIRVAGVERCAVNICGEDVDRGGVADYRGARERGRARRVQGQGRKSGVEGKRVVGGRDRQRGATQVRGVVAEGERGSRRRRVDGGGLHGGGLRVAREV